MRSAAQVISGWLEAGVRRLQRPRRIALALQGGGAHGAFTWGVLDRILEDERIEIDAISGASAGAVNASVLAMGLATGERPAARLALERFWSRISLRGSTPGFGSADRFGNAIAFDLSSRLLSPYQTNPFDLNPLRDLLRAEIDFERLRLASPVRLLVAATNVAAGRARIFTESEISLEVVLASACLPLLHQAVEIEGEAYWDGGYTANPPILPLIGVSQARDLVVVQLSPMRDAQVPRNSQGIARRAAQIGFNSPLQRELQTIAALAPLHRGPAMLLSPLARRLARLRLHRIAAEDAVADLPRSSPLDLDWRSLQKLRDHGREAAGSWLATISPPYPGYRPPYAQPVT